MTKQGAEWTLFIAGYKELVKALVGDVNLDALERLANMGGFSDLSNLDPSDLEAIASLLNG